LTFTSGERRIDALDRLLDDLLRTASDTRKQLQATDKRLAAEARKAAAAKPPPLRALVGWNVAMGRIDDRVI
jgi:hypothetical protein